MGRGSYLGGSTLLRINHPKYRNKKSYLQEFSLLYDYENKIEKEGKVLQVQFSKNGKFSGYIVSVDDLEAFCPASKFHSQEDPKSHCDKVYSFVIISYKKEPYMRDPKIILERKV
jgi:ribosomal protein S1